MKSLHLAALVSACSLAVTSCDNKEKPAPATPTPTPAPAAPVASTEVFSDSAANTVLAELKTVAKNVTEAIKSGDTSKLQPLAVKAGELKQKAEELFSKLKPEELEKYKAKLDEYTKMATEGLKNMKPALMEKLGEAKEKLEGAKDAAAALKEKLGGALAPAPAPAPEPTPAPPAEPAPAPAPAPEPAPAAPAPAAPAPGQ